MKICAIQDLCSHYTNGSKRKGHHIRLTEPCKKFLSMECEMGVRIQEFLTGPITCNLEKVRKIKEVK